MDVHGSRSRRRVFEHDLFVGPSERRCGDDVARRIVQVEVDVGVRSCRLRRHRHLNTRHRSDRTCGTWSREPVIRIERSGPGPGAPLPVVRGRRDQPMANCGVGARVAEGDRDARAEPVSPVPVTVGGRLELGCPDRDRGADVVAASLPRPGNRTATHRSVPWSVVKVTSKVAVSLCRDGQPSRAHLDVEALRLVRRRQTPGST